MKPEGVVNFDTTHQATYTEYKVGISPRKKKREVKLVTNTEPMQGDTEYGQNYMKGIGEVATLPGYLKKKTKPYGGGDGPLDTSVTRQDYDTKRIIDKPKPYKLKDNHVVSDAPFQSKSVQHTDYTKFNEPPSKTGRRPDNISTKGMFMTRIILHFTFFLKVENLWNYDILPPPFHPPMFLHVYLYIHTIYIRTHNIQVYISLFLL